MTVLDRFRLDGKVAIVTGSSSGLGVSIAVALAEAGAAVVVAARRTDRLRETARRVEATGQRALAVATDVTDPEDCERLVETAVSELGRLDILVNNAGSGTIVPALRQSREDFRREIDVNLLACHWMCCAAAPAMKDGGTIVNVSSMIAFTIAGPQAAYAASKAGMLGLTRDLAQEWGGRRRIRVNAVAPGYFPTEMTEQHLDEIKPLLGRVPSGRVGDGEELAAAVLFLASPASSYVTGTTLLVDGGFSIG